MEHNLITQRLETIFVHEDGTVEHQFVDREQPLDTSDHHAFHDARWSEIRRQRDALLAESDWMVARAFETGQPVPPEWVAYRQALRDITNQHNPFFVDWPVKPEENQSPVIVYQVDGAQP